MMCGSGGGVCVSTAATLVLLVVGALIAVNTLAAVSAAAGGVPLKRPPSSSSSSIIIVGDVRVQALAENLVRVEPRGPQGFEDRTTFAVVDRTAFDPGVPIHKVNASGNVTFLATSAYLLRLEQHPVPPPSPPPPMCENPRQGYDITNGARVPEYPGGIDNTTMTQCCSKCQALKDCTAWIWDTADTHTCWLMATISGPIHPAQNRIFGGYIPPPPQAGVAVTVYTADGASVLWSSADVGNVSANLAWPSPMSADAFAFQDRPRFYVPPWGPTPHSGSNFGVGGHRPDGHGQSLSKNDTNGYDFRNNVVGDTYIFLMPRQQAHSSTSSTSSNTLPAGMDAWHAGRRTLLALTGPTPLLPDFAFGTWFTYWHAYTQSEAEGEVARWIEDKLPLDVWGLDMNWRNTTDNQDHYYNHPNTTLFPNFTAWFDFLHARNVRTYFNDHPYPQGPQTSAKEVAFRWHGLTEWMARGLTYWWFDSNWGFSIPPPHVNATTTGAEWQGLDNRAWGAHVYYSIVKTYNAKHRPASFPRPITLNKFAGGDQRPGMTQHEHVAHHRYPVWWTGDGVCLQASIESMVDTGVYDLKPYVHSDCGGDYRGSAGDLMRWIAHCSLGTVLRLHGAEHQPWSYDNHTEDTIRNYLDLRYRLIPTFISAGVTATATGFPLVVRGDVFWPEHAPDAASNHQYIHLNETLVAPIFDTSANMTQRAVWVPPGAWQDAWTGKVVTGPAWMNVTMPYEQLPMWHRKGGMLVTATHPGTRAALQDWSSLTLEAFPMFGDGGVDCGGNGVEKVVYAQERYSSNRDDGGGGGGGGGGDACVRVRMTTSAMNATHRDDGDNSWRVRVFIAPDHRCGGAVTSEWVVRLHLDAGMTATSAVISRNGGDVGDDGDDVNGATLPISLLLPGKPGDDASRHHFPLRGRGSAPAPHAGPIAEVVVVTTATATTTLDVVVTRT
ncbi:hypothetical protein PTSG_11259 [Salpingoeca rosetta]|uniref:Uncharacterized protein n=1 Tax=Salpingoeca rosetta (strain ATCC 50818 / BSB-021) TaxID=946362 RepID=F2USW3_SALR5|nr:uncharacterized protein PTSG_11259 [Salpingoeca rosetta]EGD81222.1 hypothetical protein PTSG_11259 [Salpingoeca rosetta]|eukprot:XP_004987756.1 hypothetical protein PTSG_11259 [Salpingoeca rosetta]